MSKVIALRSQMLLTLDKLVNPAAPAVDSRLYEDVLELYHAMPRPHIWEQLNEDLDETYQRDQEPTYQSYLHETYQHDLHST